MNHTSRLAMLNYSVSRYMPRELIPKFLPGNLECYTYDLALSFFDQKLLF